MTQASYAQDAVIACLDGSDYMKPVLDAGVWAANTLNAPLGLLHAHDKSKNSTPHDYSGSIGLGSREELLGKLTDADAKQARSTNEHGQALLKQAKLSIKDKVRKDVFKLHRHETLAESVTHLQTDTQLIILGQKGCDEHKPGERLGSQLQNTIRSAHQPVLVVKEKFEPPKTALYAFDNRKNTKQGLKWLIKHPLFRDVLLHVVYVSEDNEDSAETLRRAAAKLKQASMKVEQKLISGKAKTELIRYQNANQIDMLIMGAYGHSRLHEFFVGSTTEALLASNQNATVLLRF